MQQSGADHRHLPPPFLLQYFPGGLKVLLVGIDNVTESCIRNQLLRPYYQIAQCSTGAAALKLLQKGKNSYDLILSDVSLEDMDGYQFIRGQHLRTNISHVVICGDERSSEIVTAFRRGACYVLWKPVSETEVRNLWQRVLWRREQHETDDQDQGSSSSLVASKDKSPIVENDYSKFVNYGREKKRRIIWHKELHALFLDALDELGHEKAVPKAILETMNVPFLTRENISSHLQKYRINLQKKVEQQHQDINALLPVNPFLPSGPGETSYGRFDNINNEALAHISAQPASVCHPDMLNFHPPLQNPINPHLLEPSMTSSPLLSHQSHFTEEDVALWSQANHHHHHHDHHSLQMQQQHHYHHHLAHPQRQMQQPEENFNFGHVVPVPLTMVPLSLQGNESNNLICDGMQQQQLNQNLASGSSNGCNMQQLDQNLASGSSYGCNMQQLDQNLVSSSSYGCNMLQQQHLDQNSASSSCYATTTGGGNDEIINQNLAQNLTFDMQQSNQNLALGSSYGNNMMQQQLDQNLAQGTSLGSNNMQQRHITQNLTSDMQQVNLALGSSYVNNMLQQQQLDHHNLASNSCYVTATTTTRGLNDGIINPEPTPIRNHDERSDDLIESNSNFIISEFSFKDINPENNASAGRTRFAKRKQNQR